MHQRENMFRCVCIAYFGVGVDYRIKARSIRAILRSFVIEIVDHFTENAFRRDGTRSWTSRLDRVSDGSTKVSRCKQPGENRHGTNGDGSAQGNTEKGKHCATDDPPPKVIPS